MLAVSPLRAVAGEQEVPDDHGSAAATGAGGDGAGFGLCDGADIDLDFCDIDGCLFDYIDFGYVDEAGARSTGGGFAVDGDLLPDLEVDPADLLAEYSPACIVDDEAVRPATAVTSESPPSPPPAVPPVPGSSDDAAALDELEKFLEEEEEDDANCSGGDEEIMSAGAATTEDTRSSTTSAPPGGGGGGNRNRKSSSSSSASKSNNNSSSHGKKKAKVDWTPELHRRFVQAVEQLGIDKAVPSRILELMGMDGLTRHNIASHLQKYRSHRKHVLAREAEAATWTHKRKMYAPAAGAAAALVPRVDGQPWLAPTIGFPPHPPGPPHFRPALHVWGHPTAPAAVDSPPALVPIWPRPPAAPPGWPAPPIVDWHHHPYAVGKKGWAPHAVSPAAPCIAGAPAMRFPAMPGPIPGLLPHPMYRPMVPQAAALAPGKHPRAPQPPARPQDHPSKESIDAAIGDVLVKPWLPLPLGLKPPSTDSVMGELQRQGISTVPPACH